MDLETEFDGLDAFMENLEIEGAPKKEAPKDEPQEGVQEAQEGHVESPEGDTSGDTAEGSEGASEDPDEAEVEVTVGDKAHKAKLRELKAAFAAQAAVTERTQAVAAQAQQVAATDARASAALKAMMGRAQERFKPYADLDMLVLSQRMDTETFAALRADAAAAEADVKFLSSELDGHMKATQERQQVAYQESAQKCLTALSDPKTGIEGFNQPLYNEMCAFGEAHGVPAVRQMVDPAALKMVHMAMQFAKAQAAAKTATDKVVKVVNTPKRVVKPGSGQQPASRQKDAMSTLKRSGQVDDAVGAFLASFED